MTNGPEFFGSAPGIHINDVNIDRFAITRDSLRPISERAAHSGLSRLVRSWGVNLDSVPTRYTDSRKSTPTREAALEALGDGGKQQMLDSFAWLRQQYFGDEPPERITDDHLRDLAAMGEALPMYLILRAKNPVGRMDIPEVIGNVFKASLGFRNVSRRNLYLNERRAYDAESEVFDIANTKGLLVRTSTNKDIAGYSCPASPPLIIQSTAALLFGNGGDLTRSELPQYLTDEEMGDFIDFSIYYAQYDYNIIKVRLGETTRARYLEEMEALQPKINIALGRDPDGVAPPMDAELDALVANDLIVPSGSFVDTAKKEINAELQALRLPKTQKKKKRKK